MNSIESIQRLLVVIDADLMDSAAVAESSLLLRAGALARSTGCDVELFHACHEATLEQRLFSSDTEVVAQREQLADRKATRMAEIALELKSTGVSVTHVVRWDEPLADAVLRKIEQSDPDLVMLRSHEHRYVLGIVTNADWDLIRQSPTDLWFVKEGGPGLDEPEYNRVLSAVGTISDRDDIISTDDYDIFQRASWIAAKLGAENIPLHTYEVPAGLNVYAGYQPIIGAAPMQMAHTMTTDETRQRLAELHGAAIGTFVDHFQLDSDKMMIRQGDPANVVPAIADDIHAGLIVMGARNLVRRQRLFNNVTAEPVLAAAPCDVLFVKSGEISNAVPQPEAPATPGEPLFDVERVIIDPAGSFKSPQAVVDAEGLSPAFRRRILSAWEQDINAEMMEESEGGSVQPVNADMLDAINSARDRLDKATA